MTEEKKDIKKDEAKVEETKADTTPKVDTATDDKKDVVVPDKFKSLVEEIEKMSVLDLSELVSILEDKFGVSSAAPMMAMAGGPATDAAEVEEKSEFTVELTGIGDNKIGVIKAVRAITELGLKEAKDMVDGAPTNIKENVKKEEAEEMKKVLEEAGGQVTLK
jgi:large subunit ribosomal protein L7/L12